MSKKMDPMNLALISKRLFNSPDGKLWLAHMKVDRVDRTAFADKPEETYARLAVKEFIQGLILDVNNPEELDNIIIMGDKNND